MAFNWVDWSPDTDFDFTINAFDDLEIRRANDKLHYFYDAKHARLIKDFVLESRTRVDLMCRVTLIESSGRYSPRLKVWKRDKSTKATLQWEGTEPPIVHLIKATVDLDGGHENFWRLIAYLQCLEGLDVPSENFRVAQLSDEELLSLMLIQDRASLIEALGIALDGSLTNADISVLAGRKREVEYFRRLLHEEEFFETECEAQEQNPEALWQAFFERSSWIFGYGLELVAHDSLGDGKLERITTGANVFGGGGKRVDAIMQSRALVSGLLFCEIKRHDTPLLRQTRYRDPDVYVASAELVGGVAQLQKTVRKAVRGMMGQINSLTEDDGSPTGLDFSTTKPRQIVVAGTLDEFRIGDRINGEKMESFELFRKSLVDVEVITFDELYHRAKYIVSN